MKTFALMLVACMLGVLQPAAAQGFGQSAAIAARVGTMGMGFEIVTPLTPLFNVRAGLNRFSYSREDEPRDEEINVRLETGVQLSSVETLLDFHPGGGSFRLTGGLFFNFNEAELFVVPTGPSELNGRMRSPTELGSMRATLGHKSRVNPYGGIGFGNAMGSRIGFAFDLGVLYTSSPRVEMVGTGMISPTAQQASQLEEDLDGVKIYPLLSFGLSFKLF